MPSSFAFSKFRLSVLFVSLCQTVVERLRSERNLAYPAGAQEGRHQGFHPLIFTPFPKIVWRRPETGDRFENGERQRIFSSAGGAQCRPISLPIRNVRFHTATHTISSLQARHKVNCPKGKRGSPGGHPCRATFLRVITDSSYRLHLSIGFYRRVRQGELRQRRKRRCPGVRLGAPHVNSFSTDIP